MNSRLINLPHILAVAATVALASIPTSISARQTALQRGQAVSGTLAAGDTARYTVEVGDDYFVFGEVNQISVDLAVRVVDASGTQVARFGGLGRGGERFARPFEDGGVYTLELFAEDEDEPEAGAYAITLHRVEPLSKDPKKLTDQLMARFDGTDTPGAAMQVWRAGRTLYSKAYGMADLGYGIPFRPDTRTNIGSTSKQFTAFAIMLQQERGLLSLDDDIRKHIPELPAFDEPITIRHIITHTSGLHEFINLVIMTGRRVDHGDWVDRSELIDIVQRQPKLQNKPGAEWNYNNTAFGLAALIVERTSGQPFHIFMQENVFGPLGMTRSMVRPSPHAIVPENSEGYTPGEYGYMELGDLGGAAGAGGIYTTVEDLQKWVENYANPKIGSREIFDEMMTSYILTDGDTTGYGYGLSVGEQRGLKRINHGGADIAHRSMLAYYPEINAGITVQSNHAQFGAGMAFQLAEAFFGDAMEPEDEEEAAIASDNGHFDPAMYDPEDFDDYIGRYALDVATDFIMTFTREGDTLYAEATGQPRFQIVPTSDSTFRLTAVDASITFHRNEDGDVDGLTLHQEGEQHATRLDDGSGKWEPTVAELGAFVGRYFSEEIETFFDIAMEHDTLRLHQRRMDDADLSAGEADTFSGGGFTFAFERDRSNRVIGFYLSNGRTRDIRFARVR